MNRTMESVFSGVVVRATGSWYEVLAGGGRLRCRIRGRLRLKGVRSTSPVVVGDRVSCESDANGDHAIVAVEPRRNYVIRRASNLSKESHIIAANVDQALLMVTLRHPETAPEFVDRFLVTCEAYKVPATILLSKSDLQDPGELAAFRAVYEGAGYPVVWRPLPWLSESSPVRMSSVGSMVPTSVDLPTPELPETSVVRPRSSSPTASIPSPVAAETVSTG